MTEVMFEAMPASVPATLCYIALDKGYFKAEGLDVEGKMFSSGREACIRTVSAAYYFDSGAVAVCRRVNLSSEIPTGTPISCASCGASRARSSR